ncbi:hypothetical protein ACU4GD_14950 [Cupriavidus basilensis]
MPQPGCGKPGAKLDFAPTRDARGLRWPTLVTQGPDLLHRGAGHYRISLFAGRDRNTGLKHFKLCGFPQHLVDEFV